MIPSPAPGCHTAQISGACTGAGGEQAQDSGAGPSRRGLRVALGDGNETEGRGAGGHEGQHAAGRGNKETPSLLLEMRTSIIAPPKIAAELEKRLFFFRENAEIFDKIFPGI